MTVSVLVVDDSGFFRKRLTEILTASGQIKVVGVATNGREGVELAEKLRPDVITMDYEMPVMDGISAVREIMKRQPAPVLMFSSLTYEGARVTLDALEAGAVDFLPKNFEEIARDSSQLQKILIERVLDVAGSRPGAKPSAPPPTAPPPSPRSPAPARRSVPERPAVSDRSSRPSAPEPEAPARRSIRRGPAKHYSVVAIGTSTGGPVALQRVLMALPAGFPAPVVLVQHMPASFTPAFAERLNKLCQIQVRQAEDGEMLKPGVALLAPGGKQMMIENRGGQGRVRILPGDDRLNYKPCVDVTFGSLARSFPGKTLGLILTGMGSDGKEGCRLMKQSGSDIWSQDEKTSVIYGMPMAVAKAGLSDEILALDDIGPRLADGVS
ncbi:MULTISPECIES: protein-glutamate methylesterase/protein-glutamine glutaminase [Marinobacter]|jgi:two-component system, chemotaxis family, protein-glutamate methylesterase/glutaminase|uniref:Protein-glutamate methylesterase/protein-glutamine glutaminase n=1 Tax=Marinobacter salarius TaxID=1420917 RepID=W5YQL9_9GAMM|nr:MULTISPECIES: chemotaxis response regulator protein-glutamate methylesterase [Marinobacter]AHI31517.1 chemotaxis protein CheY [Marinobacter salarius]ARM83637.1 chemotaxis response regulator protein-glutamate methylesterase of group 1 operon [Marinobacter salarius]MAB51288.1 chemotaxis response regulator protein-glutamate methylesterase [Marinobacter sp.]MBJ7299793.1 chemotaxis response regulator protein-glutamate methylesterase [Marinobacter salarius]MCC4282707.1 chemotaxis response regulat|tara:strand:- start:1372 stop:2517 length:1146 start_codon:yes stop_codon:yes gene_type:complete